MVGRVGSGVICSLGSGMMIFTNQRKNGSASASVGPRGHGHSRGSQPSRKLDSFIPFIWGNWYSWSFLPPQLRCTPGVSAAELHSGAPLPQCTVIIVSHLGYSFQACFTSKIRISFLFLFRFLNSELFHIGIQIYVLKRKQTGIDLRPWGEGTVKMPI